MNNESTHLVFNEKGIFISPDIQVVFNFLQGIEKEIESILGFNEKMDDLKESYMELFDFILFLSNKLKENNIDFEYKFKEHPEKIADKLEFDLPFRSQVIVLFASLEVLFTLHVAYEKETHNEDELRSETSQNNDSIKKFLGTFLLTDDNPYYYENRERLKKINPSSLRELRNCLTHFFSIGSGGLSLSPALLNEKARKFENILKNNKKGNVVFLSERDLYSLIKEANLLRMRRWSTDFQSCPDHFSRKMKHVIQLVEKNGAVIVPNEQLKI